jgi:hypothetical protein
MVRRWKGNLRSGTYLFRYGSLAWMATARYFGSMARVRAFGLTIPFPLPTAGISPSHSTLMNRTAGCWRIFERVTSTVAPDGRSLVTSVGTRRSAIWIHDKAGERAISSEGHALGPRLSRDGTRVFFLLVRDWWLSARGWVAASAELRSVDLASGKRITAKSVIDKHGVSPDGKWVVVVSPESDKAGYSTFAVPISGGAPQKICITVCVAFWSSDGRFFYYQPFPGKTLAIPVQAGKSLPDLPSSGISRAAEGVVPHATILEQTSVSPGPDPSTYVFTRTDNQRNLFRIPLH